MTASVRLCEFDVVPVSRQWKISLDGSTAAFGAYPQWQSPAKTGIPKAKRGGLLSTLQRASQAHNRGV